MKIPFTIIPQRLLSSIAINVQGMANKIKSLFPFLEMNLKQSKSEYNSVQYISMSLISTLINFILLSTIIFLTLFYLQTKNPVSITILVSFPVTIFILANQILFPKIYASNKIKDIEKNLLLALRAILIHLSSGISLYEVLVYISNGPYGELSKEFKSIVKKINSSTPAVTAIEESAANNPSIYYRRALWQLSNGLKAGGDITLILKEIIDSLSREQAIQIENYGSQLNPLAMFYMLVAVIMPSLSITLLVVLSSFILSTGSILKLIFFGMYLIVLFFQIIFMGLLRTRRPNLIGS